MISAAASRTAPGAGTTDRCGALRDAPCIPPGSARRSAGTRDASPCGASRPATAIRAGGRAFRARSDTPPAPPPVDRLVRATNISSPSGSLYGTMTAFSSAEHRSESLAENRFHPAEVTHQLLQRPLLRLRSAWRASPRRGPPSAAELRRPAPSGAAPAPGGPRVCPVIVMVIVAVMAGIIECATEEL